MVKHLGVNDSIFSLDVCKTYKPQFLLKGEFALESGRVPLYVCGHCADLGCGCISVKIEFENDAYIWSEFGYENNWEDGFIQSDFMKSFGPFTFDKTEYENLIHSFS